MSYEEKLELAKGWLTIAKENSNKLAIQILENLFPELQESDDEKIRKSLIKSFENQHSCNFPTVDGFTREQIIAWLKKQSKQNYIDADEDWYGFVRWFVKERTDNYTLIPSDDDIHNWGNIILNHARKLLEKKGEQKPADKVEPKFKIGDWIVKQYVSSPYVIVDIKNNLYILNDIEGNKYEETIDFTHNRFHIWTIQDAKDGDVLALNNEYFLFKEKKNSTTECYISHCFIDSAKTFRENGEFLPIERGNKVFPTTKEQYDLLFSKMKEAGYEWDFEKKELNKIEQNSTWNEKDEEMLDNCIGLIQEIDSTQEEQDWLKSLKNKVQLQPKKE